MHTEALAWVAAHADPGPVTVLDLGGRDVNGTVRGLFPGAVRYRVVDVLPGEGVDVVADAATWTPDAEYDVVVSTECFEHAAGWRGICRTAFKALRPGGRLIATMAGPGRPVHSGVDGFGTLYAGEHYGNVDPSDLRCALHEAGFAEVLVDQQPNPADVRCVAVR